MNALEMKEEIKAKRRAAFFGKRYAYNTPGDGIVTIGVMQGLGKCWMVGYFRENGSRARVKTARLPVMDDAAELQTLLDQWAHERQLPEVKDV